MSGDLVRHTYTCHMLFIGEVKVVHFLLEGVQYLPVSGHVSGQDEGDDGLQAGRTNDQKSF